MDTHLKRRSGLTGTRMRICATRSSLLAIVSAELFEELVVLRPRVLSIFLVSEILLSKECAVWLSSKDTRTAQDIFLTGKQSLTKKSN